MGTDCAGGRTKVRQRQVQLIVLAEDGTDPCLLVNGYVQARQCRKEPLAADRVALLRRLSWSAGPTVLHDVEALVQGFLHRAPLAAGEGHGNKLVIVAGGSVVIVDEPRLGAVAELVPDGVW